MIPLAAWARDADDGLLALDAAVFDPDGRARVFASVTGPLDDPEASAARRQGLRPGGRTDPARGPEPVAGAGRRESLHRKSRRDRNRRRRMRLEKPPVGGRSSPITQPG